jgi:sec-independent protein translocase protein TatA
MFGIGMPELMVILVVALVVLGPKRLPEVARTIGKAVSEFRRQSSEIMDEFTAQSRFDEDEPRRSRNRPAQAITPPPRPVLPPEGTTVAATDKPASGGSTGGQA